MTAAEPIRIVKATMDARHGWDDYVVTPSPDADWLKAFRTALAPVDGVVSRNGSLSVPATQATPAERQARVQRAVIAANDSTQGSDPHAGERRSLTQWATFVTIALMAVTGVVAVYTITLFPTSFASVSDSYLLIRLATAGGILGGAIAGLHSAMDRAAKGWELSDGTKWPPDATGETFGARMIGPLLVRPVLGGALGLLTFGGLVGGLLFTTNTSGSGTGGSSTSPITFSPAAMLFLAVLAGLFSKTMIDKLKQVFKVLLGASN